MKRLFLIIVPISIAVMLIFTQCNDEEDCKDALCTDVLMTIPLKLQSADGQPVLLDSTKVFWVNENRYLEQDPITWNEARLWGSYRIVNDEMRKELQHKEEIMHFTGYLHGTVIYECDVLVGADCCHVNYLGTESLTRIIDVETSEINETIKNTDIYSYIFLVGDEEGASIRVQATQYEISEIIRDESTGMNAEYRYKPIADFVGTDYVIIEIYQNKTGEGVSDIKTVKINFTITN